MTQNTASTAIVTVNVAVTQAPAQATLQQSGAFVSQGGTTLASGTLQRVQTLAALQALLSPAKAISSLVWSGSVVTGTTAAPHGWTSTDVVPATVAGVTPAGYNYSGNITITGASTFIYPLVSNPGSETVPGTVTLGSVTELLEMGTTYFAGLNQSAPYVLELGEGTVAAGCTALANWITANPGTIYAYLVPREWDNQTAFNSLVANYTAPNKMTYFFTTMKLSDISGSNPYTTPYTGNKAVLGLVESTAVSSTEFSLASPFATVLGANPSSTNKATPLQYTPTYGTTAYPLPGNAATFAELAGANVGWIGTGAAGGLSSTILYQGLLQDGNQWGFWYAADWTQINLSQALANEMINGSVPGGNPLYYNQAGINRLQNRAVRTLNLGVSSGLLNGQVVATKLPYSQFLTNYNAGLYNGLIVCNAEPYSVYTSENPNDYAAGKYGGLAALAVPQLGFMNIVFNLLVTDLFPA